MPKLITKGVCSWPICLETADTYWGGGGHVFWRDSSLGLVGLIASHQDLDSLTMDRVGIEAEFYTEKFLYRMRTGYQFGDVDNEFVGSLAVRYYPLADLLGEISGEIAPGAFLGTLGFEWQPANTTVLGLAFFSQGAYGDGGYGRIIAGLRYYFGPKKSLIQRHTQDDPENLLPDGLDKITVSGPQSTIGSSPTPGPGPGQGED